VARSPQKGLWVEPEGRKTAQATGFVPANWPDKQFPNSSRRGEKRKRWGEGASDTITAGSRKETKVFPIGSSHNSSHPLPGIRVKKRPHREGGWNKLHTNQGVRRVDIDRSKIVVKVGLPQNVNDGTGMLKKDKKRKNREQGFESYKGERWSAGARLDLKYGKSTKQKKKKTVERKKKGFERASAVR